MSERLSLELKFTTGVRTFSGFVLALSVALPLALFSLPRQTLIAVPEHARYALALSLLVFIPFHLIHYQLARGRGESSDMLSLARSLRNPMIRFVVGWLSLAGYSLVAALLLRLIGEFVALALSHTTTLRLTVRTCTLSAAGLILFKEAISRRDWWGARTAMIGVGCATILGVLVYRFVLQVPVGAQLPTDGTFDRSPGIAVVFASLFWASDAVFVHSGQLKKRVKGALVASVGALLVATVAYTLMVVLTQRAPSLFFSHEKLSLGWRVSPLLLAGAVSSILVALVGVSRMTRSAQRVALSLLPERDASKSKVGRVNFVVLLLLLSAAAASSAFIPRLYLASGAGTAFLWVMALVCAPVGLAPTFAVRLVGTTRSKWVRPWALAGLLLSLFLSTILPWHLAGGLLAWLVLGILAFVSLSTLRQAAKEQEDEGPALAQEKMARHGVLAVLTEGCDELSLARLAHQIARARGTRALLLRVVSYEESLSPVQQRRRAMRAHQQLGHVLESLGGSVSFLDAAVRVGPSVSETMRSVQEEVRAELALVGFLGGKEAGEVETAELEEAFRCLSIPTGLLFGRLRMVPRRVLAHIHAQAGPASLVQAAEDLVFDRGDKPVLSLIYPATPVGAEVHENLKPFLRVQGGKPELEAESQERGIEIEAKTYATHREGWQTLGAAPQGTLVVVETAHDSVLGRAIYGGPPLDLARTRHGPTLIYKPEEPPVGFVWRRVMEQVVAFVPPLDEAERVQILTDQARAARGTKDFYFLMVVASVIAIAGLIADSGAVVIGAMLVAPLMQPIIGLAMGIAVGSGARLRRSAKAIATGAVTSIGVATLITMLFPIHDAPPQVLARVSPNLLDLIVALAAGAAGSYGAARKSIAGAIPGVAISVALVPPLCVVGFGLGSEDWEISSGALLLFLTNLAGIILVSTFIFTLFGFRPVQSARSRLVRWGGSVALTGLLLLAVPLAITTFSSFEGRVIRWRLKQMSQKIEAKHEVTFERLKVRNDEGKFTVIATLLSSRDPSPEEVRALRSSITRHAHSDVKVELIVIRATVVR